MQGSRSSHTSPGIVVEQDESNSSVLTSHGHEIDSVKAFAAVFLNGWISGRQD